MGERLRLAFGIMGNGASVLLYGSPILTFGRVIKKKSTEEFSCIPYIVTLMSCLLWTWYGLPIVSHNWENFPLVTIGCVGSALEVSFVTIYLVFTSTQGKIRVMVIVIPLFVLLCIIVAISTFAFHDHHLRKVFVGAVGNVLGAAMYASPLVAIKQVIKTKSVEFMPFYLSFFSFLASFLWLLYGLLSKDLLIAAPSFIGCPLAVLQLVLYFIYHKRGVQEEARNCDVEQEPEKTKQMDLFQNNNDCNCKS